MLARRCLIALFAGICAGMAFVSGADAATRYVSLDGGHDESGGFADWSGAATTIQAAVNISADGDVILVSNGVYTATVSPVVNITRLVEIQSVNGAEVTIIDGQGERSGVHINQSTVSDIPVCIAGFTIANCFAAGSGSGSGSGAGIYIYSSRDVNISDCIISNNIANYGGGIHKGWRRNNLTLSNCWFSHNEATNNYGGGVYAAGNAGRIELFAYRFVSNSAALYGGGFYASDISVLIDGCQFVSNTCSSSGGGVMLNISPDAVISRCTFEDNQSTAPGGALYVRHSAQNVFVSNCVFRGNMSDRKQHSHGWHWWRSGAGGGQFRKMRQLDDCW
jgi:predicted outer membrane repeat protein